MEITQALSIKGKYRLVQCDPSLAPRLYEKIVQLISKGRAEWREYRALVNAYHRQAFISATEFENLIPTVGRSVLAQRLAGTTTYTGTINYAALGSGTTTPINADTKLATETYRKTIDSQTYANNIAYLSAFVAAGVATATHYEAGLFIDGTASADSGQIFSHVLFSPPEAKTALASLTLDISVSIA